MLLACPGPPPFFFLLALGWIGFVLLGVISLALSPFDAGLSRSLGIASLWATMPVTAFGLLLLLFDWPSSVASLVLLGAPVPAAAGLAIAHHRGAGTLPDPNRCRVCDYELRGLIEPRCPECGTPFAKTLMQPPPPAIPADAPKPSPPKRGHMRRR